MKATLVDPEEANLLAIILHRCLTNASGDAPSGTFRLRAGGMVARLVFGADVRVESRDGPADCSMEGDLATFIRLALGGSCIGAWLKGRVHLRGNPFGALALLKVLKCKN